MSAGGQSLRLLRERLGLTMRDVETASYQIAARHGNDEFAIPPSRLSDIETKGVVPSIYRLYSFAVIYRASINDFLGWYGIDLDMAASDLDICIPPRSHVAGVLNTAVKFQVPVKMDPAFDPKKTSNFGRMVEQWGLVPLAYLAQFATVQFTYGYIGTDDMTMYPILPPGSFVQVDETRTKILEGGWRSEYERPIYFIETRGGHVCCWCAQGKEEIILQPHPLSPVAPRSLKYPQQAEIIGQVVGVAMRLGDWRPLFDSPDQSYAAPRAREALN